MEIIPLPNDRRFINLTNMKFGRLTVVCYNGKSENKKHKWLCYCECGNKTITNGSYLKNGSTKSCGCLFYDYVKSQKIIDLVGKKFGRLTVESYNGMHSPKGKTNKQHKWNCLCECGNRVVVRGNGLKTGTTQSCGCLQKERTSKARIFELSTGTKFNMLTVLSKHGTDNKSKVVLWECICDCGNKKNVAGHLLRNNKTKSCGCYRKIATRKHGLSGKPGYKALLLSDPVKRLKHNVGTAVKIALQANNGSKKGQSTFKFLPYTIDELKKHLESLWEPWMNWGNYGGKNNDPRLTWHIDHIKPHSAFNYTSMEDKGFRECWALSNLQPLEKIANMSKGNK